MSFQGSQLKMVRLANGLTQEELCSSTGISQGRYSKIEKELSEPNQNEIQKISMHLNVHPAIFFERIIVSSKTEPQYRRRQSLSVKEKASVEAIGKMVAQRVNRLLSETETTIGAKYPLPEVDLFDFDIDPVRCAKEVRSILGFEHQPIRDLYKAVESFGIFIIELDLSSLNAGKLLDGFTLQGERAMVFLNGALPLERKRFTLAHELGHLVMHPSGSTRNGEEQANVFASELLMPESGIRSDLSFFKLSDLRGLKLKWRTSIKALIYRAAHLGLIDDNRRLDLYKQYSARGWSTIEPNPLFGEKPELLGKLMAYFQRENGYSTLELSQIMNLDSTNKFLKYLFPSEPSVVPSNVFKLV